jgi:hypothetical protein
MYDHGCIKGTDRGNVAALQTNDYKVDDDRDFLFGHRVDGRSRSAGSGQVGFGVRPHHSRVLYRRYGAVLSVKPLERFQNIHEEFAEKLGETI